MNASPTPPAPRALLHITGIVSPHPASHGNLQLGLHKSPLTGSHRGLPEQKKGFTCRAAAQTHPEDPVGRNHRGLVVDSRELDVDGVAHAVLPQARVVGPHSEAVVYGFTAVVDVVDELVLHLVRKGNDWIYYSEYSKAIFRLRLPPPSY